MKKVFVLGTLFILPIVVYLFFASGVNNFAKLPILTSEIEDVNTFQSLSGEKITISDKITVLGFLGNNLEVKKGNAFNLNQKIYKRFNGFEDFQFVMILPEGSQDKTSELLKELSPLTDTVNWKFVFAPLEIVQITFNNLGTPYGLDANSSTPYVFIIDKDRNLRGRKDDNGQVLYGYDATSVAELNNKMLDDVKIVLAEYRMALKKYNKTSTRDSYLKKIN